MTLDEIIEAAYALFAPYPMGPALDVCKLCCVTEADERALLRTPLRAVSCQQLDRGYFTSAHGGSDRELAELKHFLPRLLELVSGWEFPVHSTEIALARVALDHATGWPVPERALLQAFAETFFGRCLGQYPLPGGHELTELLVMFGLGRFDLAALLAAWAGDRELPAALHLKDLLLHEVAIAPTGRVRLQNAFADAYVNAATAAWLGDAATQQQLAQQLEDRILTDTALDDGTRSELSMAYDVLLYGLIRAGGG